MFCVIYRFEVVAGCESEFERLWHQLTELIREHQ